MKLKKLNPLNNETHIYSELYFYFLNMVNKMFSWEGLPKEIPQYVLEALLHNYGECIVWKVGGHYFCGVVAKNGKLNVYARMEEGRPICVDGNDWGNYRIEDEYIYNKETKELKINKRNAVLLRNNLTQTPTLPILRKYISRLDYIWGSIGIAEAQVRTKRLWSVEDAGQKSAFEREINELTNGVKSDIVVINKSFNAENQTQTERASSGQDIKDLWYDFLEVFALLKNFLGIKANLNTTKAERMITSEVEANEEFTLLARASMLEQRQFGCEDLKEVFGLETKVISYFDHRKIEMGKMFETFGLDMLGNPLKQNTQIDRDKKPIESEK